MRPLPGSLLVVLLGSSASLLSAQELTVKFDHFGYRPADTKIAIATTDPGATAWLESEAGETVFRIPEDGGAITAKGTDGPHSGDEVWWIDFSDFEGPGTFRLRWSGQAAVPYTFDIDPDVYRLPLQVATKAFFYQRCNTGKTAAYAGTWSDETACHTGDATAAVAAGHGDLGALDLTGGWHDAGDYNKYVWPAVSDAIGTMLWAFEDNPGVFGDGGGAPPGLAINLDIPESGNGLPDLLDEVRYELDWLLRMQRPSGAVLNRLRQSGFVFSSPPSTDSVERFYQDPTTESTAVALGCFALAARIFRNQGETAYANQLEAAADDAWNWLAAREDSPIKIWAGAELLRLDPTRTTIRNRIDNATNWGEQWFEIDDYYWRAAVTYLQTPGATASISSAMRARLDAHVDQIFAWSDLYRVGMADWQYYWGSNRPRALYGLFLLQAAKLGSTGSRSVRETREHAQDFLHYLHGQNALNMLYLTNMQSAGGEHSSYQIFHGWFGNWDDLDGRASFIGRPTATTETAYPYFDGTDNHGISDNKVSQHGPVPGLVPGGPNIDYGSNGDESVPPMNVATYDRAYRDWADQSVWTARTWEITEPSISYQGPYVALAAYFAGTGSQIFSDGFESGTTNRWD